MAHTTYSLHLLVILLGFTHLIFLNAVPIGRTRNLLHETQSQDLLASENTHKAMTLEEEFINIGKMGLEKNNNYPGSSETEKTLEEEFINIGRMDLEINNDYPGSGANNRHTPKPPLGSQGQN
ncbi:hypothetical protein BVC80_1753g20 [Macleaya cordata]|uniref:Uncharacterized protein n=1 Tax=Macleaya cordata TaxID=56857 RepID=A0A200QHD9_MACCD|nr:hypothetical protein BVC80_1753g20 [Macleaya cordata]